MATELAKAYVQIVPSAKGISGSISRELGPEVESAGSSAGESFGGKMVSTLKKVVIAAGVGKIVTEALNLGGELEQNLGGTEAVFGEFASDIQSTAQDAYKNMGLSASDYMATANKMGSLFQGSGVEQQKSLEMTSEAMQRAADVASVMGVDTSMAMESIAGAAKGNFTMMDNLGVAMNATALQAYALEKGINFDWNTASQAEKSELAMKMFMDRTQQYAGNFARESETTFSGSMGALKASFQDVLATMSTGGDWGNALEGLMSSTVAFVNNLMPMLTDILRDLPLLLINVLTEVGPQLLESGMQMVGEVLTGWGLRMPDMITKIVEALSDILITLVDNIPMLVEGGITIIVGLVEGLIQAIPILLEKIPELIDSIINAIIELIPLIVDAGVKLLTSLVENLPTIIQTIVEALPKIIDSVITGLLDAIPQIIDAGVTLLTALIDNLPTIIMTIVNALPEIISSITSTLIDHIPDIIETGVQLLIALVENLPTIIIELASHMPEIISGLVTALIDGLGDIVEVGAELVRGLWDGIKSLASWLWDKVTGWITGIWDGIKSFFGISSPSKLFAGLGENLNLGLADGITDNLRPVSKAMDQLEATATRSFESDIAIRANAPSTLRGLTGSVEDGQLFGEEGQPASFTFVLEGHRFSAFVDDITKVQDREVELALAY